jgi:quinol monooxygenase YgiN
MKLFQWVLVAAAMLVAPAALAQAPAPTQGNQTAYAVTYLEVVPSMKAEAVGLLKASAEASHKEAGNQRYDILQRTGRDNEFAILEAWSDRKAFDAHAGGAAMTAFRDKLTPLRSGPYDERPSVPITVAPASGAVPKGGGPVYAITHVDVAPNVKDQCIALLNALGEAARKEPGSLRFEAWQQDNRTNHFTVSETWKDRAALDAHRFNANTREFREKLAPMLGALYDMRIYTSLE